MIILIGISFLYKNYYFGICFTSNAIFISFSLYIYVYMSVCFSLYLHWLSFFFFQNKSSCFTARMKNSPLRSSEALYWHVTEFDRGFNLRLLYWPYWNYIGGRRHRYRCQNSAEVPWDHWQQTFRLASRVLKILYPERTYLPGINFSHCFLIPRRTFFCIKHISLFFTISITA